MRIPSHPNFIPLAVGLLVATLAVPASAGSFFKYETEDGGIAFTDDPKRIPAAYRDDAETIQRNGFGDFDRYTHAGANHVASHAGRTDARLDHLRNLNARMITPDAVGAPMVGPQGLAIRSGRYGQSVESYSNPRAGDEPVIVETVRSRPDGSPVTRHITIVRQGDQILSVIAPKQLHSSTRWLDERTLFE